MTAHDLLAVAAAFCGVLMGLAPALQTLRLLRTRSARDLSLPAIAVLLLGACVWLAYGLALGSVPLVATNVAGVLASSTCVVTAVVLRRGGSAAESRSERRQRPDAPQRADSSSRLQRTTEAPESQRGPHFLRLNPTATQTASTLAQSAPYGRAK